MGVTRLNSKASLFLRVVPLRRAEHQLKADFWNCGMCKLCLELQCNTFKSGTSQNGVGNHQSFSHIPAPAALPFPCHDILVFCGCYGRTPPILHFPHISSYLYVFHGLPHHLSFSKVLLCQLANFSTFLLSCLQAPHKTFGMESIILLTILLCHNTHRNYQTSNLLRPLTDRSCGYTQTQETAGAFYSIFLRVGMVFYHISVRAGRNHNSHSDWNLAELI